MIFQSRTSIPIINTWTAVTIPIGAINFTVSMEDKLASFRVSFVNTISATGLATYIGAAGKYLIEGSAGEELIIYVSSSTVTTSIAQYN